MNLTISKRDAKLLLILLGIIILLVAYLAVYNPYTTRTEAVEAETAALQPQLQELQGYYQNIDSYYAGIDSAAETVEDELRHYPAAVRSEAVRQAMEKWPFAKSASVRVTSGSVAAVLPGFGFAPGMGGPGILGPEFPEMMGGPPLPAGNRWMITATLRVPRQVFRVWVNRFQDVDLERSEIQAARAGVTALPHNRLNLTHPDIEVIQPAW